MACKQPSKRFARLDLLAMLSLLELSVAGCFSRGCFTVSSVRSHLLPPYLFRRLPLPPLASFLSIFFFTFCSYELPSPYIMLSLVLNFDICFLSTPNNISSLDPCYLYEIKECNCSVLVEGNEGMESFRTSI